MKERNLLILCIIILCFLSGFTGYKITNRDDMKLIEAYDSYNKNVEALLDTLDAEYNWVDAYDPQEYYSSREHLDSLLWK